MSALLLDNIPPDLYDWLEHRAAAQNRSPDEEAVHLLQEIRQSLIPPPPRLPDLIVEEEPVTFLELPRCSQPEIVQPVPGLPRLPDPPLESDPTEVS
jgi:hypothetical protein